jgi:hypothetical protein
MQFRSFLISSIKFREIRLWPFPQLSLFSAKFLLFPPAEPQGMAAQASPSRKQGFRMKMNNLNTFSCKAFS